MNNPELMNKINNVKARIEKLIENGCLEDAKAALKKYNEKMPGDPDIYSMLAVIHITQGKLEEAETVLLEGLQEDSVQYDLLYNLAYVHEQRSQYRQAADLYGKAATVADSNEQKRNVDDSLERLRAADPGIDISERARIVFFVKKGMDNFLGDIINGLSEKYWVRKIIVSDFKQIDAGMEWADVCWFEWCDKLVAYGSRLPLARQKKIICRLHSYEAFSEQILNVVWGNIDRVIFVAEHIRSFVLKKQRELRPEQTDVISNGIDIDSYTYKDRSTGFKVAYVGYINYKKGPMLLLHTFKALFDKDNRYKLYIAGKFQDYRDELYYSQMIREFGIENNVFFEGWQSDINKWLEDKNYILCTSILESQNLSVMQAMCKGIKPIVHNFVGAREIYEAEDIWNTVDEAVESIRKGKYESEKYRTYIINRYSLEKQLEKTKGIIKQIEETDKTVSSFNYASYWNNRLNEKFDIEGVGYYGLGEVYNTYLYSIRFEMLDYFERTFFIDLKGMDILELGPGIGMFTEYFHQRKPGSYKGIDISTRSVHELSKKFEEFQFVEGDISNPSFYDTGKNDLIFAADVLLHLTDEKKYRATLNNISSALKNNGLFICFDPITTIMTKSLSHHLVIRNIRYVEEVLDACGLSLAGFLPSAFFMNYPFDMKLMGDKASLTEFIFRSIQSIFGGNNISDVSKKVLAEWLAALEKLCLIKNGFGLSQKALIIKKRDNPLSISNFAVRQIWDEAMIMEKEIQARKIAFQNSELVKLDTINILAEVIQQLIH